MKYALLILLAGCVITDDYTVRIETDNGKVEIISATIKRSLFKDEENAP